MNAQQTATGRQDEGSLAAGCRTASAVGACTVALLLLAGCGQKGPLKLDRPATPAPAASAPAT